MRGKRRLRWIEGVQRDGKELGGERLDHREPRSGEGDSREPIYVFTDSGIGDVRGFLFCDKAKAETAKFVMSGDYARWKQVAKKGGSIPPRPLHAGEARRNSRAT